MKQKLLPRVGRRLLTLVAILMMVVSSAFAGTISDAQACYNTVTNPEYRVDDATHNALYKALKDLIDSNSTDSKAIDTAIENAYRQYYYDFVATDVIVYTNYLNKEVVREDDSDDATINAFKKALETAATTYGDGNINLKTPSATYKDAHEKLTAAFQALLEKQYANAKKALEAAISAANTAKGTLAYDENKTALQAYINAASTTAPVTRAGVKQLRAAKTTLAGQTTKVVADDKAQAITALDNAIAAATSYKNGTVAPVSDVVAAEIDGYITTANNVKTNEASTAIQIKDAAATLTTNRTTAETHFTEFKTAKEALNTEITAATTLKGTFGDASVGAKAFLQDAIDTAQGVYDAAKAKTTAELTTAKNTLATAETTASGINTKAVALNDLITTATTAKNNAVDATVKANIQAAIDAVQPDLNDKTKTAANLQTDYDNLNKAVKDYVSTDIAGQRKLLADCIAKANKAINETMAYDANKTELSTQVTAATAVKDNASATAAQLAAAKTALDNKYNSVVNTDNTQALEALKTSITNATTRKTEIAQLSTVVADELTAPIATATGKRDNDNSAKVRVEAAKTLDAAVVTVNADLTAHQASKTALKEAIDAATTAKNAYKATHTGVIAQAQDAINKAQAVLDAAVSKSKAELDDAKTTLNTAKAAADAANTAATNLETAISTANTTKASILDATVKANVETKVAEAEAMLKDKTKTAADLDAAKTALSNYVESQVTADIDIARTALSKAITAATTAKDDLGYDANKSDLATAITTATGVKNNASATAQQLIDAKTTLEGAQTTIKATDDAKAKTDLATAITAAQAKKTSLETLAKKLATYPEEQSLFNTNVINDLATAITTAQGVQDNATATGKQKVEQVNKLNTAVTDADTSLKLYYNTQCQKLADEYTADKNLNITVEKDVTVLPEVAGFATAFDKAEEVYVSVKSKEDTYDVIDVILARKNLQVAYTTLKKAYDAWKEAANTLNTLIGNANTLYSNMGTQLLGYNNAIYTALGTAITTAQGVYDNKKTTQTADLTIAYNTLKSALTTAISDNTAWVAAVNEFNAKKEEAQTAYDNMGNSSKQPQGTNANIYGNFGTALTNAKAIVVSQKTAAELTTAKETLATALTTATTDNAAWVKAVDNLNTKISEANTALGTIQRPAHQSTYDALNTAIQTAKGVYDAKANKTAAELNAAASTLNTATENAVVEDTKWSFTDKTPNYKGGTYAAGNVTYTRSGSAIADGKYGSFCLPFEVATDNFAAVYVPAPFAIYNAESNTYKMFFKKVTSATIAANTPFLAKLNVDGTLNLHNNVAVEITTPGTPATTKIEVYNQSSTSSFVEFDANKKFVWNGTLAKKDGNTANDITFGTNGSLYKAGSYINPFRAYLQIENVSSTAKIVVDLDEDEEATGIEKIINTAKSNGKVYSVDGKFVGNDKNKLGKGIYIINGKKFIK